MKFHYYIPTISEFVHKHPSNGNQLLHMLWSSFTSYTNLMISAISINAIILQDSIHRLRLLSLDIGTSVNKILKCKKRKIHLPSKYQDELAMFINRLPDNEIKTIIEGMGSTWGALISAILQDNIILMIEIARALINGEGINDMLAKLNANTVLFINVIQAAGNKPVLISKGIKVWTQFNDQFIGQIQAIIARDNIRTINLYNELQLQSFPMANFFNNVIL